MEEENLESLKKELEDYKKKSEEYLSGWQRARADFLNYKKEEVERIEGFLQYAREELILKILPILDNFDLVEKKLPEDLKNNENVKGILQIKTQYLNFLKSQGIEEVRSLGEKFDPNFHEVLEAIEVEDKESGIILEEVQKGYTADGKLLRPAKVKVSK